MPPTPELRRARGAIRAQEIERQPDPQAPGDAHGDEAVAGEVVVNAQSKDPIGQPDLISIGAGTPMKLPGQIVGQGTLEEEPQRHPAEAGIDVGGRPPQPESLNLREQGITALDGPGHDLREESGEVQEIKPAGQRLTTNEGVHGKTHQLKRVKRNARRNGHRTRPRTRAAPDIPPKEVGVLVIQEREQLQRHHRRQDPTPVRGRSPGTPGHASKREHRHTQVDHKGQPTDQAQQDQSEDQQEPAIETPVADRRRTTKCTAESRGHQQGGQQAFPETQVGKVHGP